MEKKLAVLSDGPYL